MNNKTKLNIKATIIIIIYISIGVIVARFFQVQDKPTDGFIIILLFIIGLLVIVWSLIKDILED